MDSPVIGNPLPTITPAHREAIGRVRHSRTYGNLEVALAQAFNDGSSIADLASLIGHSAVNTRHFINAGQQIIDATPEPEPYYIVCRSCGYEREAGIGCGLPCV